MKTLRLIITVALLIPLSLMAQKGPFDDLFNKYSDSEDVTSIMFSFDGLKIHFADAEEGELGNLINQISKINILKFENHYKSFRNSDFYKEVNAIIEKNNYEQLVDVKSGDENVGIYIIEGENGLVKEGLIIVNEDEEAAIISVRGNMKPADFLSMHSHVPHFYGIHNNNKNYKHR